MHFFEALFPSAIVLRLCPAQFWLLWLAASSFPILIPLLAEMVFWVVPGLNEGRDTYVNISPLSVFSNTRMAGEEYYTITHRWMMGGGSVRILVTKPPNTIHIFPSRLFCLRRMATHWD